MSSSHFGAKEQRGIIRSQRTDLGYPLSWLMVRNARIIESTSGENGWVGAGSHIVVWRILQHACRIWLNPWISPLFPFGDGQRYGWITHCRHHIHERNFGDNCIPKLWAKVDTCSDHQTASATTAHTDMSCCSPTGVDDSVSDCVDIIKSVAFVLKATIEIPVPTHLTATARMGQDPCPAAIYERQSSDTKPWWYGDLVTSVGIDHGRRSAVRLSIFETHDVVRNFRSVKRRGPIALGLVITEINIGCG